MTNEVTKPVFGGNVAMPSSANLAAALKQSASKNPRSGPGEGTDYLNFSGKRGLYSYGADQTPLEGGREFIPNIAAFEDGWVCWKGGRPVATRLSNMMDGGAPSPDFDEFAPFDAGNGEGWFAAKSMMLKDVGNGQQFYFKINSVSGVSAIAALIDMIADRAGRGEAAWPVITLDMEQFTAKGHKNFKPRFDVSGWLDDENVAKVFEEGSDLDDLLAASEVTEAEPVDEAPTRRRRKAV